MQFVDIYEHFRLINKLLFVAWVFGWWITLGNFTLNNFDLIIRTSDEAHVEHRQRSTKFLSSYHMIKHFKKKFDWMSKHLKEECQPSAIQLG